MDREERMTSILQYMAKHRMPCRVTEVSKELRITKSSVSRILMSLERLKWVTQLPSQEYVLGNKMLEFCSAVLSGVDVRNVSRPFLEELNDVTKETVGLNVRIGMEDICIDQIESKSSVRHVLKMGVGYPLWSGATGKVILANISENETDEVLSELSRVGEVILASGQALQIDEIKKELAEIRRDGYAVSLGERTSVTAAVAAPIFERNKVIGGIAVTGPLPRFDEKLARSYDKLLIQAARNISIRLGST